MADYQYRSSSAPSANAQNKWLLAVILLCAMAISVLTLVAILNRDTSGGLDAAYVPALRSHDPVIARVNESPIYMSDVVWTAQARGLITDGAELDYGTPIYDTLLEELIDQRLLAQEAQALKLQDKPDIRHRLQLARERILADAMSQEIIGDAVDDDALKKAYAAQIAISNAGPQVRLRQIVLPDEETAEYVVKLLDDGQSFSSLALAYSTDRASRENDGDLGYISRDMLDPKITEVAFSTDVGEIAEVFETKQGWHVIEVMDKRTAPKPNYESIKPELARLLGAKALHDKILNRRATSTIVYTSFEPDEPATRPSDAPEN